MFCALHDQLAVAELLVKNSQGIIESADNLNSSQQLAIMCRFRIEGYVVYYALAVIGIKSAGKSPAVSFLHFSVPVCFPFFLLLVLHLA